MPTVAIVILNWNGWKNTLECLGSLYDISYANYRVIIVDNCSTDGSVKKIQSWINQKKRSSSSSRIKISFILNSKNEGFVGGNNIAISQVLKESNSKYVLLLNNDTFVSRKFLTELVEVAESDKDIGIVGPKIYFYNIKNKKRIIESVGATINLFTGKVSWCGAKQLDEKQFEDVRDVDYVEGTCLLIKREAIQKVGLLNEKLFAYFDDVDLCLRAKEKGYHVLCAPGSFIWHKGGETSRKIPKLLMYYRVRNRFLTVRRFASKPQYLFFVFFYLLVMFPLWTIRCLILLNKPSLMKYFFKGLRDGLSQQ